MNPVRCRTLFKLLNSLVVVSLVFNAAPAVGQAAPSPASQKAVEQPATVQAVGHGEAQQSSSQPLDLEWPVPKVAPGAAAGAGIEPAALDWPVLQVTEPTSHTVFLPFVARSYSAEPEVEGVTLEKHVEPWLALPGDVVTYTLAVHNGGQSEVQGGLLVDSLPPEIEVLEAEDAERAAGELRWNLGQLRPGQRVVVTVRARVAEGAEMRAVQNKALFTAALSAGAASSGDVSAEATATLLVGEEATGTLTPEGGEVASSDERVRVVAPPGAVTQTVDAAIVSYPIEPADPAWEGHAALFKLKPDRRFEVPVTVTVDLAGYPAWLNPYLVRLADGTTDQWEVVASNHDEEAQQLVALRDSFSTYGVQGSGNDVPLHHLLTNLPNVSAFNGSATYAYPIEIPPGRGGLAPNLSLSYSSAGLNGMMGAVQSSEVGLGWSLGGSMQIVRSIGTFRVKDDDKDYVRWEYRNVFDLVINGTSHRLVGPEPLPGYGGCRYYAEDAPSLLVMRYTPNTADGSQQLCGYGSQGPPREGQQTREYWVVTDSSGTTYRYGYEPDAEQLAPMRNYSPVHCPGLKTTHDHWTHHFDGYAGQATHLIAYRWSIDRIRDVYGNAITYRYDEQPRGLYIDSGSTAYFDREQHLDWIRYTGNDVQNDPGRLLVDFVLELRVEANDGASANWHDDGLNTETLLQGKRPWAMWDNYRIDRIRVCADPSGVNAECAAGNLIAVYDLDYQFVEEPHPGSEWLVNTVGHETTRLQSITRYGSDGVQSLPPATFYYHSLPQAAPKVDPGQQLVYPRLVAVENGYGGRVDLVYDPPLSHEHIYSYRVARTYAADGLGHTSWTDYGYEEPCFNSKYVAPKCWRRGSATQALVGHRRTTVTTFDHTGEWLSTATHTFITEASVLQGRQTQSLVLSLTGEPLQQTDTTWGTTLFGGAIQTIYAHVDEVMTTDYGGDKAASTRITYLRDGYGNVTAEYHHGDVDAEGDERSVHRCYYSNDDPSAWIVSKLAWENVYQGITDNVGGRALKTQTIYYYDDTSKYDKPPERGELTKVVRGLGGWRFIPTTRYQYDDWGNVTAVTDALGRTTRTEYDPAYHQFPVRVTDAKRHTSRTEYYAVNGPALGTAGAHFGAVYREWGPNGEPTATEYRYDVFGRVERVIRPYDSPSAPTVRYEYHPYPPLAVPNSSFENRGHWFAHNPQSTQQVHWRCTETYHSGDKSVKITAADQGGHWVGNYVGGVQPGRKYYLSAYVKTPSAGGVCLSVAAKDGHEAQVGCVTATGDWRIVQGTITLPPDATHFLILLRAAGTVYVDDVQVHGLFEVQT